MYVYLIFREKRIYTYMFRDVIVHGSTLAVLSSDLREKSMRWPFAADLFQIRSTDFSYESNFDSAVLQAMKAVSFRA